ncbi:hypothetical protein BSKO_13502 [Bryopsis sp. KO-2023]|nr:hypothetical protein BSKO_13502 [Bryopsis sp. KO-2023]
MAGFPLILGCVVCVLLVKGGLAAAAADHGEIRPIQAIAEKKILSFIDSKPFTTSQRRKLLATKSPDQELLEAIMLGDASAIISAISEGADPNYFIQTKDLRVTPLIMAVFRGEAEVVRVLLDSGSHPDLVSPDNGLSALDWAVHKNFPEIVKVLISGGASFEEVFGGITNLHYASIQGFLEIVTILLDEGSDIESRSVKSGATPLILAAQNGQIKIVRELIRRGADVNARNDFGGTALHYAALHNHVSILRLLMAEHADVNVQDSSGLTALYLASFQGQTGAIGFLLGVGADPELGSNTGRPPRDAVCECVWDVAGKFEGVECNMACTDPIGVTRLFAKT